MPTTPLALARRLNQIRADDRGSALPQDIIVTVLTEEMNAAQFDLIIDATANAAVASRLEYCRARSPGGWPPVMTMLIGHQARRGVVAVAGRGAVAARPRPAGNLPTSVRTSSQTLRGLSSSSLSLAARTRRSPDPRPRPEPWPPT